MKRISFFPKNAVILFLILSATEYVQAVTYYVSTSTSASNSNSGLTVELAWATPSYAATRAQAGDTICLMNCTWYNEHVVFENSGNEGNPIIMKAYDGAPTLDGADMAGYGIYIFLKSYITIDGISIKNYERGIYAEAGNVSSPTLALSIIIYQTYIDRELFCEEKAIERTRIKKLTFQIIY